MMFHIRQARPDDNMAIAAIQHSAGQVELAWAKRAPSGDAPDVQDALARIEPEIWVAEQGDGRVLGFVAFKGNNILWLYVDPGAHRRGVGRALFRTARDLAGPYAYLEMLGGNDVALNLYLAEGFVITDREMIDLPGFSSPVESLRLTLAPLPDAADTIGTSDERRCA